MKKLLTATLASASLAITAFSATSASAEKWDMALAYPATNYHSEADAAFAKEVAKKTDGKLDIVTHPNGSLYSGSEIYSAVRRGLVPIGERLISALSNTAPIFGLDSIPFIATDFKQAKALYEASKPELVAQTKKDGVHLLYSCPWPPQGLYSAREVTSPEVLKGMKFRAYNADTATIAKNLGMIPTQIEAADLSQAFATGVADSMISSGSTGYDTKLWEHVKYFYDIKAWLPRNMVVVNERSWKGLDAKTQKAVDEAAADTEKLCWDKAESLSNWYIEQFKTHGMVVEPLPADVLAAFKKASAPIKAEWLKKMGPEGEKILSKYEELSK